MANLLKIGAEVLGFKAEASVTAPDSVTDGAGNVGTSIMSGIKSSGTLMKTGAHKLSAKVAAATDESDKANDE